LITHSSPSRLEHLHVAGVGGRAVEALRGDGVLAQLVGDVGVVEVGQALAGLGIGQEEVPQPGRLGLGLEPVEQLELAVAVAPALLAALAEAEVLGGHGFDLVRDERHHRLVERPRSLGHGQVERVVGG
jgi:hypothetical protein